MIPKEMLYRAVFISLALLQTAYIAYVWHFSGHTHAITALASTSYTVTRPNTVYEQLLFNASLIYMNLHKPQTQNCNKTRGSISEILHYLWHSSVLVKGYFNGNSSKHNPQPGTFMQVPGTNLYLTSAYLRNRIQRDTAITIAVNGWEEFHHQYQRLFCCLLLKNGSSITIPSVKDYYFKTQGQRKTIPLRAVQYVCYIQGNFTCAGDQPLGVKIVDNIAQCVLPITKSFIHPTNIPSPNTSQAQIKGDNHMYENITAEETFLPINYPAWAGANSLGLCAKIIYGQFSFHRLIEWIEIYRHLGVDKIVMFYYNLDDKSMRVLRHYAADGFLDIQPFDFPQPDEPRRYVGQKIPQVWNDEQLTVFECAERLQGYQYVGIFDTDEIILPNPQIKDLKEMLARLLMQNPNASDFYFSSEIFVHEWNGRASPIEADKFFHTRYNRRTRPMINRKKNIFLPSRTIPGVLVGNNMASIKHYRACPPNWHQMSICYKLKQYPDNSVIYLIQRLKNRIINVKSKLFGQHH